MDELEKEVLRELFKRKIMGSKHLRLNTLIKKEKKAIQLNKEKLIEINWLMEEEK